MRSPLLFCLVLAVVPVSTQYAGGAEPTTTPVAADPEHLTLEVAEQLFREHSRELLSGKRAIEIAEADRIAAAQRPNPTFSAAASSLSAANWSAASGFRDKPIDTGVQLSQLIESHRVIMASVVAKSSLTTDTTLAAAAYADWKRIRLTASSSSETPEIAPR